MKFRTPVLGAAAAAITAACTSTEAATETSGTAEAPPAILEPKEASVTAGTVDTLLLPENRDTLKKVLTAHVVAGDLKAADLIALAAANGGTATLTTVSGDTLTFAVDGGAAIVTDENGGRAIVTAANVDQSNGIIHVVDKVLLPN